MIPVKTPPTTTNGGCTSDANCSSGYKCITSKGLCGLACASHQDCVAIKSNTQCDNLTTPHSCVANPCTRDGDCPGSTCSSAQLCVVGTISGCTTTTDCPHGQLCQTSNSSCVDPCTSDVQCGFGHYCGGLCYAFAPGECAWD